MRPVALHAFLLLGLALAAHGQLAETVLTATNPGPGGLLGWATASDDDTIVLGSPLDSTNGPSSGAAYVFVRSPGGWIQQQKLTAPDGVANDRFAMSVDVSGDTVVTGSPDDDDLGMNSGSVYVFVRNGSTWNLQQKLVASDGAAGQAFGRTAAICGDTILVGAPSGSVFPRRAYLFTRTNGVWSEQQKLAVTGSHPSGTLGDAVALDGDRAVIGESNALGTGAAYVFDLLGGTWIQQAMLVPMIAAPNDDFGAAVDLNGDTVVVGAPRTWTGSPLAGAVHIFTLQGSQWVESQTLVASDASFDAAFGASVGIEDGMVVVGSPRDDGLGSSSGALYAFSPEGGLWVEKAKITTSNGGANDYVGSALSLCGSEVVTGSDIAPHGAGYLYDLSTILPPHPGTWEDLDLVSFVNGAGAPHDTTKSAPVGSQLSLTFGSPGATLVGTFPIMLAQAFPPGLPHPPAFPGIAVNHLATPPPVVVLAGGALPPNGITVVGAVGAGLSGLDVLVQAYVLSQFADNGIFASTHGHVFSVP